MPFAHEHVCRVTRLDGDPSALGGAVTAALCGNWDHDGPCRWPHHTIAGAGGGGDELVVTVRFDAPDDEVDEVCRRIVGAVRTGTLVGPDGVTNRWQAVV